MLGLGHKPASAKPERVLCAEAQPKAVLLVVADTVSVPDNCGQEQRQYTHVLNQDADRGKQAETAQEFQRRDHSERKS